MILNNSSCGHWAWFHSDKGYSRYFCGQASCPRPECRQIFWSRRVRLISALIEEHDLRRFFTLTLDPEYLSKSVPIVPPKSVPIQQSWVTNSVPIEPPKSVPIDPWLYIHEPWVKLRHRMKRAYPDFKFVAILERHKYRDVPHIHGFTNVWQHVEKWSKMWNACKGGKIVWVERVKDAKASEYVSKQLEVAKYVGKDNLVGASRGKDKFRTLWRTRGLKAEFELTSESGWGIIKEWIFDNNGNYTDYHSKRGVWDGSETKQERKNLA